MASKGVTQMLYSNITHIKDTHTYTHTHAHRGRERERCLFLSTLISSITLDIKTKMKMRRY